MAILCIVVAINAHYSSAHTGRLFVRRVRSAYSVATVHAVCAVLLFCFNFVKYIVFRGAVFVFCSHPALVNARAGHSHASSGAKKNENEKFERHEPWLCWLLAPLHACICQDKVFCAAHGWFLRECVACYVPLLIRVREFTLWIYFGIGRFISWMCACVRWNCLFFVPTWVCVCVSIHLYNAFAFFYPIDGINCHATRHYQTIMVSLFLRFGWFHSAFFAFPHTWIVRPASF